MVGRDTIGDVDRIPRLPFGQFSTKSRAVSRAATIAVCCRSAHFGKVATSTTIGRSNIATAATNSIATKPPPATRAQRSRCADARNVSFQSGSNIGNHERSDTRAVDTIRLAVARARELVDPE